MTEDEWNITTDLSPMLAYLRAYDKASERKLRLFACACCRTVWNKMANHWSRMAVLAAERHADRQSSREVLSYVHSAASQGTGMVIDANGSGEERAAARSAFAATDRRPFFAASRACSYSLTAECGGPDSVARASLFRDIFGNPFRPATIEASLLTPSITALAREVYEHRTLPLGHLIPERLAALAEALGPSAREVVEHLRAAGPHVRGCWAVDLLLGKA